MNPNRYQPNAAAPAAQTDNLLYRRITFGRASATVSASVFSNGPQIANLRYSRVQLCATSAP
jgi:hypothetical protein